MNASVPYRSEVTYEVVDIQTMIQVQREGDEWVAVLHRWYMPALIGRGVTHDEAVADLRRKASALKREDAK